METSKIGIFERISLLSVLIPYSYSSHEGFLFLSILSRSIREYLLEHYPEYRRFMFKYAKKINYVEDKHLEMKLPLDLFQFSAINVRYTEDAKLLVGLIHKLTNKGGLYFGEHYMSDQICFEKIYVCPEFIPKLHPHIESLNSIKVFPFGGQDYNLQHSFLDLIFLDDIFNSGKLKACFFKDSKLKRINPIYESFKRIKKIYLDSYENACKVLDAIKQASIEEIEEIGVVAKSKVVFKQITNLLCNYKIHTLKYGEERSCKSISNQTLEIISKINPQKVHLGYLCSISSLFRIFLHLREDINVSFGCGDETHSLKFEKTLVIFKTKDDMIKAYCDKVEFTEDLRKENILFLENYVKILNFYPIHVENLKIENLPTKITLEDLSLDDSNSESYILIPRNNLSFIKLNLKYISNLFENEISVTEFKSLSLKTKIIIEICSMEDLAELNKLKEHFPEHSELEIDHFYNGKEETNFDKNLLLAILSKFKLTSIIVESDAEDIFMSLLQMPSIQETLEHFCLELIDIAKSTSLIEMLVQLKRIKTLDTCFHCFKDDDKTGELKCEIYKFEKIMEKKHPEIELKIDYIDENSNYIVKFFR